LVFAAELGKVDFLRSLVGRGADINVVTHCTIPADISGENRSGHILLTPVQVAIATGRVFKVLPVLAELGADLDAVGTLGKAPLEMAFKLDNASYKKKAIEVLVEHGANVAVLHYFGGLPLDWAVANSQKQMIAKLLEAGWRFEPSPESIRKKRSIFKKSSSN